MGTVLAVVLLVLIVGLNCLPSGPGPGGGPGANAT